MQQSIDTIIKSRSFADQTFSEMMGLCSPAFKNFGFTLFEYARIYDNGTAITLYSDSRVANYVISKQLHITAHVPQEIISKEFWFLPDANGPYSRHMREFKDFTNAGSFANYIRRFEGYYEMFCFGDPAEQYIGSNKFINQKETLEHFALNFVEQAKHLISSVDQDRFKLTAAMQPNFGGLKSKEQVSNKNLQLYLTKIQRELMNVGSRASLNLTSQEQKCISYLIQGKTALDTAELLNLSKRTIEMHLNSIRDKLGCRKKSDIISALIDLENS